jgi:hypothetical protein
MKITLEGKRYQLPKPAWEGELRISTGITLDGVYIGNQSVVLEYDSAWVTDNGYRTGTYYRRIHSDEIGDHLALLEEILDTDQYERICDVYGVTLEEIWPSVTKTPPRAIKAGSRLYLNWEENGQMNGQYEIGRMVIDGENYVSGGSSHDGAGNFTAYHDPGNPDLLDQWCGKTMMRLRSEIIQEYKDEWGETNYSMIYRIPSNRGWLIAYVISLGLIRGEYVDSRYTEDEAKELSIQLAEQWHERDLEDEEAYQEQLGG